MSLPQKKIEILETLLLEDKPAKAVQVAKDAGSPFRPIMMHLIGLTKTGHAKSPQKGMYVITEKGKFALGLSQLSEEKAKAILDRVPSEKAFHFYCEVGKPLDLRASSLEDFSEAIKKVDLASIEFHMNRGDFEAWFECLGDDELTKKAILLKSKKLSGEPLRGKFLQIIDSRCKVLNEICKHSSKTLANPSPVGTALRVS